MVDWSSTAELTADAEAFLKLMHCLAGWYFWEWAISLDFDWDFISGKRKFRWPLTFYFMGRYSLFAALIGILVALDTPYEINCQALYTYNQFIGQASLGFASINLSIRTMAVWAQSKYIVIPLVIIIMGHWSLILQGVLLKAEWVPGEGCAITQTNNTVLAATFIYSMCFDAIVMGLNLWKLSSGHSQLYKLLFKDGIIYFIVAFLSNLVATVFMLLNLNSVMSVIFNVPAAVLSTIVASRAVRRLVKFTAAGPEVFTSSVSHGTHSGLRGLHPTTTSKSPSTGVHIQMHSFTAGDGASDHAADLEAKNSVLPMHAL